MKLDYRIRELIAVGTSVGANCHSCLEYHFGKAREQRVPDDEITETICDRPKSVPSPNRFSGKLPRIENLINRPSG